MPSIANTRFKRLRWVLIPLGGLFALGLVAWTIWREATPPTLYDEAALIELERSFAFSKPTEIVHVFGFGRRTLTPGVYALDGSPNGLFISVVLEPWIDRRSLGELVEKPDFSGDWVATAVATIQIRGQDVPLQAFTSDSGSRLAWVARFRGNDGNVRVSGAIDPAVCDEAVVMRFFESIR